MKYAEVLVVEAAYKEPENISQMVREIKKKGPSAATSWKIPDLVAFLKTADQAYYNDGSALSSATRKAFQQSITDQIYDDLLDILRERSPRNQYLNKVGAENVKQPVAAPTTTHASQRMTKLPFAMSSLDKLKPDTVTKWLDTLSDGVLVSDKVDGVSLGVTCNGKGNISLYSRGNGETGQDVSYLLPHIKSMKSLLKHKNRKFKIRGELVIPHELFKQFSKDYKNPRNLMSGIMNKSSEISPAFKDALFVAYSVIEPRLEPRKVPEFLKELGVATPNFRIMTSPTPEKLTKLLSTRKHDAKYDMDGLVLTSLGSGYEVPKLTNPKNSRAYKDPALVETATTKVKRVEWRVAKSGIIAPLIWIEPVDLCGTTVNKATGNNAKYIKDAKIGPGAVVLVTKRGEIIPKVEEVITPASKPSLPTDIPYKWDGVHIVVDGDSDDSEEAVEARNQLKIKQIMHFFRTLGVENLSDKFFEKLFAHGYDSIPKLARITKNKLLEIPGFKDISATKAYNEIHNAISDVSLVDLMYGSSCFNKLVGTRRMEMILDEIPDFMDMNSDVLLSKILQMPGFSDATANAFMDGLAAFKDFYSKVTKIPGFTLVTNNTSNNESGENSGDELSGEVIVFTGFRDKDLSALIKQHGGSEGSSVTSKTTILVVKDMASTSSKATKARSLGIKIMAKPEFEKWLNKKLS